MRAFLSVCLLAVLTLSAQPRSNSQRIAPEMQSPYLELNREAVAAFDTLDRLFPMHYLINEEPHVVYYHISYDFKNEADYRRHLPSLLAVLEELKRIPSYRIYTETIDTTGNSGITIVMSPKTDRYGQSDYLRMDIKSRLVYFEYMASAPQMKMPTTSNQHIADSVDGLLNRYIHRSKVRKEPVSFDGNRTHYKILSFYKKYDSTYRCSGTRYIVPDCTEKDLERFYRLFRSYALVNDVSVASNDVYFWYEETGISVHQNSRRPLMVAAALKGTDLYLIRCEGDVGSQGWLPRAWAEDNPVWDYDKLRR